MIAAHAERKACRRHPTGPGVPSARGRESKALPALWGSTVRPLATPAVSGGGLGASAAPAGPGLRGGAWYRDRHLPSGRALSGKVPPRGARPRLAGLVESGRRLVGPLPVLAFIVKDLNSAAPEQIRPLVGNGLPYLVRVPGREKPMACKTIVRLWREE